MSQLRVRSRGIGFFLLAASGGVTSCSETVGGSGTNSSGEACDLGSLDCECYGNDSCDGGLTCLEDYCSEEEAPPLGLGGDGPGDGDGDDASGGSDSDEAAGGGSSGGAGSGGAGSGGAGSGGAGSGGDGSGGQPGDCDTVGFPSVETVAYEGESELRFIEKTSLSGPGAQFHLELFYYLGAPSGPYQFSAWENYQTCSTCGLIFDCPDVEDYSPTNCTLYEVDAGTLDITVNEDGTGPGAFQGTLTNVHAREVTINQSQDSLTTPVQNGLTWCIESLIIDLDSF